MPYLLQYCMHNGWQHHPGQPCPLLQRHVRSTPFLAAGALG
ncbi:MAG TPA: hypothetical protein VLW50_32190 [Streptosporangiaceae bacterium]|nr:hypothetical protein [Streptosporangiaceae bacterium]